MRKMSFYACMLLMAAQQMCVAEVRLDIFYRSLPTDSSLNAGSDQAYVGQNQTYLPSQKPGDVVTCHAVPPGGKKVYDWGAGTGANYSAARNAIVSKGQSGVSYDWTCTDDAYQCVLVTFDYIKYKIRCASSKGTVPAEKTLNYAESYSLAPVANIPAGYEFKRWDATSEQIELPKSTFAENDAVSGVDFGLQSYHKDDAIVKLTAFIEPKKYAATAEGENCTVSWNQKTGTYDEELELAWNYGSAYKFVSMTVYAGSDTTGKKLREYTSEPAAFKMSELNAYYEKVFVKVVCEKKTYSLTVDPNGGSYNGMKHIQVVGKLVAGEPNLNQLDVSVHTNYFDGYWDTKFGGNKVYDANGRFNPGTYWDSDGRFVGTSDLTVYALWGDPLPTHQVHLAVSPTDAGVIKADYSGVQTTSNDFALTVVENFGYEVTASSTNSGYSFSCWTNSLGLATNDNPWTSAATSDVANVAVFTGNVYKVTYHGGEGTPSEQVKFVSFGGTYGEPETPVTAEGKAVEGWYRDQSYAEESRVDATNKVGLGNIDLYANWRELGKYTICFSNKDEKVEGTMADQTPYCETETALNTNCYTKTGYTFSHWDDEANATNYLDGAIVKDLAKRGETNTLYAVWSTNVYWVDFNPNGGKVSTSSQQFTYDEPQNIACEPTHPAGLAFAGWSTNGVTAAYTNHESVVNLCTGAVGDERIMLLALWKPAEQDVGDYSRAMDCDNLRWEASKDDLGGYRSWTFPTDAPYAGTNSVRGTLPGATNIFLMAQVPISGTLSFSYRSTTGDKPSLRLVYLKGGEWLDVPGTDFTPLQNNKWRTIEPIAISEGISKYPIALMISGGEGQSIDIDGVTWTPDGTPPPPAQGLTNAVPTAVTGLVYNGEAQTGVLPGTNCTIVGNVATNAGTYTAVATVTNGTWEGGSFAPTNIQWTIAKAPAPDVSGVSFADATYEYDGESHSIAVSGTVPDGVEVVYSGDPTNRTEAGVNTVTASFKVLDEVNYEAITTQLVARLTIKRDPPPKPVETNAVPTAVTGLVYNGEAQTGVEAGANYTIVGNVATNAGTYTAVATVTNGVWEGGATGETNVTWTIARAAYDMTGVTFTNETYEADGTAKSIFVSGALPPGVTVAYEGNGQTEPGTYTVTAKFTGDAANYEAIPDKTATLTISQAGLVRFEAPALVTTGGSNLVVVIWGGATGMVSSVQLQAVYNTASSADLDLKKAKVDGIVQPSFKFPYTLKWREGELGARVVEIPVVKNKSTESDEFLTLQLGSLKNVRISSTDGETENGGVCTVTIRGPKGPATGKWYARAVANDAMRGSVSGSKLCKKGTKVTFKASAKAGFAFAGWKTNDVLATTAASWSFKMPAQAVEAMGYFVPQGEDYLVLGEVSLPSQLKAGESVTLPLPQPESISRATVKVTGLPSGLKYDSKQNAITGKPKKASSKAATVAITVTNLAGYRIVRKYQVRVVKTVTSTDPAELVSESAPCGAVTVAVNDELWGKVTGMGVYAAGAKVTLKATASTGYVFTGWETNGVAAVSRTASWSFTMPAGAVVAKATFRPIAEDYLEFARDFLPAELPLNVSTNIAVPEAESLSQPKVTISGLPSGLSYSSASGSIGGKPKKAGAKAVTVTVSNLSGFKIVRKYKVTVVKGTPKAGFASLTAEGKPYFALTAVPDDVLAGTTSGTGVRQEGKKVTVKATALAGYVFGGWYEGDDRLTQKASYSFTMPGREMKLVAGFVTKAEDAASVGATVGGLGFGAVGGERMTVETNVYCGVRVDWPVVASAASLPSVKVTGLPSGLSYKSGKISGAPTAVSKVGKPSTVKVTVATAGKATKTFSIVLTVVDREPWARGTYTGPYVAGGLTNGTMTLTVAKNGKISGKIVRKVSGKTKTTALSVSSVASRVQDNDGVFYRLEPSYKSGKTSIKMPFVLQPDLEGSGQGVAASEEVTLYQKE